MVVLFSFCFYENVPVEKAAGIPGRRKVSSRLGLGPFDIERSDFDLWQFRVTCAKQEVCDGESSLPLRTTVNI